MNENLYILIMAGGEGTRFHPVSTPEKPKQFLNFYGGKTFIQHTYDRISDIVRPENVYIATNEKYIGLVREQLPSIPEDNIIGETAKKNTAPCIAYASHMISERDGDAIIAVLPSDHIITKEEEFKGVLQRAIYIATERDVLVTLGIQPTWPADCYGYIRMGRMIEDDPDGKWPAHTVTSFVEKPTVEKASEYLYDGTYVWNSGMFIWRNSLILKEIETYLPNIKGLLNKFANQGDITTFFDKAESISIDYGVMERSERVVTIPCSIGWSDIGSWESLNKLVEGNVVSLEPHIEKVMREKLGSQ